MEQHPWLLLAPWYDWPLRTSDHFGSAIGTAPMIQKFTPDDYVRKFVADPQASYTFGASDQVIQGSTPVRKLFQATHARLYLVTCELVCEERGLPAPSREAVCQAGVVIRRRRTTPSPSGSTSQRWNIHTNRWEDVAPSTDDLATGPYADPDPDELIIDLFPLAPSGGSPHDAADRTIYFAGAPTASSVHDPDGRPQFDGSSTYDLRCFVRRHDHRCTRRNGQRDCYGPLTWSKPSEPFVLADPVDVDGCGQHRVTIAMPDVNALKALATKHQLPATARFASPGGSGMTFPRDGKVPGTGAGTFEGADNCFFSIPLITLIAKFVLSLFMAIVLFVFQAWWMLALRFCLPQASVEAAARLVDTLRKADPAKWAQFLATKTFTVDSVADHALVDQLAKIVTEFNKSNPDRPIPIPPTVPPGPVVDAGPLLDAVLGIVEGSRGPELILRTRVTRAEVGLP
jgi:hypothetical protein